MDYEVMVKEAYEEIMSIDKLASDDLENEDISSYRVEPNSKYYQIGDKLYNADENGRLVERKDKIRKGKPIKDPYGDDTVKKAYEEILGLDKEAKQKKEEDPEHPFGNKISRKRIALQALKGAGGGALLGAGYGAGMGAVMPAIGFGTTPEAVKMSLRSDRLRNTGKGSAIGAGAGALLGAGLATIGARRNADLSYLSSEDQKELKKQMDSIDSEDGDGMNRFWEKTYPEAVAKGKAIRLADKKQRKAERAAEKAAAYYDEAQLVKEAAEADYAEACAYEEAALSILSELGYLED